MDVQTVTQRILEAHGDTVAIVESTYVGFKKKAMFIDSTFGSWNALVYAVCRGQRHPERFRSMRRITFEEAEKRIKNKHGELVSIKHETWTKASNKCTFIDVDYGEWNAYLCNVLAGIGHPNRVQQHRHDAQCLSIAELQIMVNKCHDELVKVVGPYVNMGTKCLFTDVEFGNFEALPLNVVRGCGHIKRAVERRRQTSQKRYGTDHHMQNDDIFHKNLRSQRKHIKAVHWKTGEILDCINTWEYATVKWLNARREDFLWQPKAFKMPDGRTYRPDAYLSERNLWIDIKGWYPKNRQDKCEWFKSVMSNFELWFKEKLIELGILK